MPKSFLAYFMSEDDAQTALAGLEALQVSGVYIDEMPQDDTDRVFLPIVASGYGLSAGMGGAVLQNGDASGELFEGGNGQSPTHLIEGKVAEDDYEAALHVLKEASGFMEKR